jgi:hypothetical protein
MEKAIAIYALQRSYIHHRWSEIYNLGIPFSN